MFLGAKQIVSAAIALGVTVAGFSESGIAADKLRVGTPLSTAFTYIPLSVGIDQGIFAKAGLDVERIDFAGGAQLQSAMLAGAVDISLGSGTDMRFITKGAPQKAVAAIVITPANIGITVGYNSTLKSFDDLKGKTVGVSSLSSLTGWLVLKLNQAKGWGTAGARATAIGGSATVNVAAIKTGQVDAAAGDVGVALQAEDQKDMKLIGTFSSVVGQFVRECIYAPDAMIKNKPDVLRRFVKAWFDSVAFMKAHKDVEVKVGSKVQNVSPSVESRVYDIALPMFSDNGKFAPAAVALVQQSFVETGLTNEEPDLKGTFTEAFLPSSSQ